MPRTCKRSIRVCPAVFIALSLSLYSSPSLSKENFWARACAFQAPYIYISSSCRSWIPRRLYGPPTLLTLRSALYYRFVFRSCALCLLSLSPALFLLLLSPSLRARGWWALILAASVVGRLSTAAAVVLSILVPVYFFPPGWRLKGHHFFFLERY